MFYINEQQYQELKQGNVLTLKACLEKKDAEFLFKRMPNRGFVALFQENRKACVICELLGIAYAPTSQSDKFIGLQCLYLRLKKHCIQADIGGKITLKTVLKNLSDTFSQKDLEFLI